MNKLFIFDLDGTLANLDHRISLVKNNIGVKDWPKFFENCDKDKVNDWVADLFRMVKPHGEILILSGRSHEALEKTKKWLISNNIMYDYIALRPPKDYRPDEIVKLEMLEEFLRDKDYKVQFIVDDRQKVVDMWRANGYNVLQCNAWEE